MADDDFPGPGDYARKRAEEIEMEAGTGPLEISGLGIPFEDLMHGHAAPPDFVSQLMGYYRVAIEEPEGWTPTHELQDSVLKSVRRYQDKNDPDSYVIQFTYPLPTGLTGVYRYSVSKDDFPRKQ